MKSSSLAIACALALAAGSALAADKSGDHSVVDSTKSTVRNAGEKLGHMLHLDKGKQTTASNGSHEDTRAMGASRSKSRKAAVADPSDTPSREDRMDNAYDSWKSQHGHDKQ